MASQGSYGRIVNMTKDKADEFDALILKGASLTDPEARRKVYEEIQLKAQQYAVNIWMYQVLLRCHLQSWIQGYYFNPAHYTESYTWIYALSKKAP